MRTLAAPILLVLAFGCGSCTSVDVLGRRSDPSAEAPTSSENPPNILEERQNVALSQVNAQLNDAFVQLFFGDPETEAVFFDQGDGTGYIEDIANAEVRTDSMGYGMLVTVQLNQREVFDKLWAWAKTYMKTPSGPAAGLLRWNCDTAGKVCATNASTDASSLIATSLFMAEGRWGAGGAHDYAADGQAMLDAMTSIEERNGGIVDGVVNCFDAANVLPRKDSLSPGTEIYVDYLMPAFYEIWARYDVERGAFWREMAARSRSLLSRVSSTKTGLFPEIISYAGDPVPGHDAYRVTTARTLLNLALDHLWFGPETWVVEQNTLRLDFFLSVGVDEYVTEYTIEGTPLSTFNTVAHRALVALAAGTTKNTRHDVFLQRLLEEPIPTGTFRYYDGMLYMISLLALSGQMTPN